MWDPGRSKLNGEWQAVQLRTDVGHDADRVGRHRERGIRSHGALEEQLDRRGVARRAWDDLRGESGDVNLSLSADVQRRPAGDERGEVGARLEQFADRGACVEQVLERVQHEQ